MDGGCRKKFIISHCLFLATLISAYFIPFLFPLVHDKFLPPMNRGIRFLIIGVFSASFLFYYLSLWFSKKLEVSLFKLNRLGVFFWVSTCLVFLFLCTSRALLSSDLYEYSIRARMLSIYGLNPYLHLPIEIKSDIFFPLIFWKTAPECYGPLWVGIGALHSLFFKQSLLLTVFMHKFILMIFLLSSAFIFHKLSIRMRFKYPELTTLALILNPLLIIMTVVGGHNEIAMVFFVLLSALFLLQSKWILSFLMLALAVHVKFVYLLLIPLYIIYFFANNPKIRLRKKMFSIVLAGTVSLLASFLLWLPFGIDSFKAILVYYKELGLAFCADSLPYVVYFVLGKCGVGLSKYTIPAFFSIVFFAVYFCLIAYFLKKVRADKPALFNTISLMLLAVLFTNSTPFQSWYLIWVVPFILLSGIRFKFLITIFLTYFLILTFWKRMSVLAIPMAVIFFFMLKASKYFKINLETFNILE